MLVILTPEIFSFYFENEGLHKFLNSTYSFPSHCSGLTDPICATSTAKYIL